MQVTEAAKGQQAFFRTNNGGYGTQWEAGMVNEPAEVPQYKELGERNMALKNSQRTYKHQVVREMRENGEVDAQIYAKIKSDMSVAKKQEV